MRLQVWRKVKAAPKGTLGTYAKVGQVTVYKEVPRKIQTDGCEVTDFITSSKIPISPGDLLFPTGANVGYKVLQVGMELSIAEDQDPWEITGRKLYAYERFAKDLDYTQCSGKKLKP
jgi:hypothetical protein